MKRSILPLQFTVSLLILLFTGKPGYSQIFPIAGGPVTPGVGPVCFPVNIGGVGFLEPPGNMNWSSFIDNVTINITTTHPQTLRITLVSPSGTTLLLSAFNGAGGANYTNTVFTWSGPAITSGTAPFTGSYYPQGAGGLSVFNFEWGSGIWNLCIEDTLTDTTSASIPGPYMGTFASGTIAFGANPGPPPCFWTSNIWNSSGTICAGVPFDLNYAYAPVFGGGLVTFNQYWTLNGVPVSNPSAVTAAGTYHVHFDDGTGCTADADFTLNVVTPVSLGSDQSAIVCGSAGINLNSLFLTAGNPIFWYLNNVLISGTSVTNATAPGVYTIVSGSSVGFTTCYDTAEVTLTNNAPVFTPQALVTCSNEAIDLSAVYNTTGMTSVTWTLNGNLVANPSAVNAAGNYVMTATASTGCTSQGTVALANNTAPALGPDLTGSVCSGLTVDLTTQFPIAGTTPVWTFNGNPVANPSAVSQAGTYTLIATDANGCADTADYFLNTNSSPSLGLNQNVNVCAGTIVDLSTVFNLSGLTASWMYGATPVPNPSAVTQSGSYDVTVTDANGCTDFAQVMVAYSQAVTLGANQNVSICDGSSLDLTGLFSTTGLTTQWDLNGVPVLNPSSVATAGAYTINASSSAGCTGSAQVTVAVLPVPVLSASQTLAICGGNSIDLTALYSTAGLTTSWTYNSVPSAPPVAAMSWGDYIITATAANGCTATSQVTLDILPKPNLGNDHSYIYCQGNPTDLNSYLLLTGLTIVWTESGIPVPNPAVVGSSGSYVGVATNADGCSDTVVINLQYDPAPALGADQSVVICAGDSVDISALYSTSGMNVSWTFNAVPINNPVYVSAPGDYQLIATNGSNCADDAVIHLSQSAAANPGTNQDITLCEWQTADLNSYFNLSSMTATWQWNGNAVSNVSSVNDPGTYTLNVTDANGCTGTAQVLIHDGACKCEADFTTNAACTEFPSNFKVSADSAIIGVHWNFGGLAEDSQELNPTLQLSATSDSVSILLVATLSCGVDSVIHKVMIRECVQACQMYFPAAFTPNDDGVNEMYTPVSDCMPDNYELKILNRFGQVVFASTNIKDGWTASGENGDQNEVYVYRVSYQFPYQKSKTESGKLTLVR